MSAPGDQWFMQEILQAMMEGGGDPRTFPGQQANDMLSELSRFAQQMEAGGPAGALSRSIMGPSDGAEAARILEELPAEQRKALLAAPLSLGLPPLHLACTYASVAAVEALLDAGAPLQARAHMGFSALHVAAFTCRPEVVDLLLKRGANPLQLDSRGRTPRQHCVDSKGEGALPDVPPAEKEAAIRRCTALLEAAEAAAAPELHRIKKSQAQCEQCGKQEDLKKCSGCTLAWYCGVECAKRGWPSHKQRCKVAQEMRRRLAVLADLSKSPDERWDAMQGIAGSVEASRLAGKLSALKLLGPALSGDKPTGMGPPPLFPQYIPSVRAINEVAWVAASKERAWNAPIPPLVQQFCALRLPEQLLERVSKRDAPADNLERTLDVMSQLSLCKCAQALGRQLVACGSALSVARLLCALPWGAAGGPSRGSLGYAADIIGGMLEAERAASVLQQQRQQQQQQQQQLQQLVTALEAHVLTSPAFLNSCHKGIVLNGDMMCTDMLVFLCSLYGSPATLAALKERPELVAMRVQLFATVISHLPEAPQQPGTVPAAETTPAFISWLAAVTEQRPAVFNQLKPVLSGGQPPRRGAVAQLRKSLAQLAQMLASRLASGQLPPSCDCLFMHVEGVQRKAATLLLSMVRDLDSELGDECRAALSAQQLRAAAAAVERRGGQGAGETADLLRQAAAVV